MTPLALLEVVSQALVEQGVPPLRAACERLEADGWSPVGFTDGEVLLGVAIRKGTEVHLAIVEEHRRRVMSRRRIRLALRTLLDMSGGYLTTRARIGDDVTFVMRLGFKPTWRDDQFQYFLLDRLPFERKEKR